LPGDQSKRHAPSTDVGHGIRSERKLTQEKVAEFAGLHPNYISLVERGQSNISICNVERIAAALGVSMSELVATPPSKITTETED